jgi:uncharacterized membrane protein YbaN (DUF454 family)
MTWSLFTHFFGIPVSETHGLIGGLVGAAVATAGLGVVQWQGLTKVLLAIIASPSVGFVGGSAFLLLIYWTFRRSRPGKVKPWFRHLQRMSAAYMAFSHGRNDAQKPMGILAMALALYVGGEQVQVPMWVVVSCAAVAALGTAYGGWRIIHTLGQRITTLDPVKDSPLRWRCHGDPNRIGTRHSGEHDTPSRHRSWRWRDPSSIGCTVGNHRRYFHVLAADAPCHYGTRGSVDAATAWALRCHRVVGEEP